ncbi:MAG: hypothetical protein AUJ92_01895 [Armatimonadetes bacterium CG2_30_59_28]|nr:hypothetical protein [Armatimonadota bacterium]OIO98257.1 MAG: hypothetical protein AUJ92_01895 [Armatimonadetes bacterium CG2_30_59_28]PIU62998.1 MAG: hypothetical protein COS85_17000 [Armatimonadetes bacterium CG07_land_8_20_14_0_80_59_28]PIX40430.1 MAG: hypothetical protein COZ56_14740 [Armatimonadetes bacterium CG_4_8_14_3_um_filter_58_9]PIY45238.1 MAG: hypothetical protein COZ05_06755 [Armatimonadetes bacterium CG_4_10_14_3_um_filter_59_10]
MKAKRIAGVALLLFATGSLVVLAAKELRNTKGDVSLNGGQSEKDASVHPEREVVAYYFHTSFRCPSCVTIERLSGEAIEENFESALSDGRLSLRVVNVEEPGNEHFVQDYQLVSKSLVLVERVNGSETRHKNLQRVWELLRQPDEFKSYVRKAVATFLEGAGA